MPSTRSAKNFMGIGAKYIGQMHVARNAALGYRGYLPPVTKRQAMIGGGAIGGVGLGGMALNNRRRGRRSSGVEGLMPQSSGGMMMY